MQMLNPHADSLRPAPNCIVARSPKKCCRCQLIRDCLAPATGERNRVGVCGRARTRKLSGSEEISSELFTEKYCGSLGRELSARAAEHANVGSNFHTLWAGSSRRRAGVRRSVHRRNYAHNLYKPQRTLTFARIIQTAIILCFYLFVSRKSSASVNTRIKIN